MSDFIIVNQENLESIAKELTNKKGHILIAEPGHGSFENNVIDAHLSFYGQPLTEKDKYGDCMYVERGERKDRNYLLRPKPQPSNNPLWNSCRDSFERLAIGPYEFSINLQSTVGRGLFTEKGITLYIPKDTPLKPAFRYGLSHIVEQINATNKKEKNKQFLIKETDIEKIVDYAIEDLKTNKIFSKNVSAGVMADQVLGL
ncbi:MAG: hypothetical protein Q8N22_00675 [bacterium]|nr:hypothetical protein [bacterium]